VTPALITTTGATAARSAADHFADAISVKDFVGFDSTGVADSYAAITAALTLMASLGGGAVYISGTPSIGTGLVIPANCYLAGDGMGSTTLTARSTAVSPMITLMGADVTHPLLNAGVQDLTLIGLSQLTIGIRARWTNRCFTRRVRFFGHNIGWKCADAWQFYLQDTWADGAGAQQNNIGYYADYAGAGSDPLQNNAILATNANAQNVVQYGWRIENAEGSIFTTCQAMGGIHGLYLGDPPSAILLQFMFFIGFQTDSTSQDGILLSKGVAASSTDISFTGTWAGLVTTAGYRNIRLNNMDNVLFSGTTTDSSSYSLTLDNCTKCNFIGGAFRGYDFYNAGAQGIIVSNSTDNLFIGLEVSAAPGAGAPGASWYEPGTSNRNIVSASYLQKGYSIVGASTKIQSVSGLSGTLLDYDKTLPVYASNAAAAAAGLQAGMQYRQGDFVAVVH
jgi:hypothetical protein